MTTGYDFDSHNHVVRAVSSSKNDYTGEDLGKIQRGESKSLAMNIAVDNTWKLDNCKVLLFVTTPDDGGSAKKFYVNNTALCDIGKTVVYEY